MARLRDLELLAALARHAHFARAADACGISQPAFSARIRALEDDLGVPVVMRGNRFQGFTQEGEIALKWARRMLDDADGLREEIAQARGELAGRLRFGTVPTALTMAAEVPARLNKSHPKLVLEIRSATSTEILRGVEDFSFDLGLTYLDGELPETLRALPVYTERYVLLAPTTLAPQHVESISWSEVASLPLCLLVAQMHNRAILDQTFASAGVSPEPVSETNSFSVAIAQARAGVAATILPEHLAQSTVGEGLVALPLVNPVVEKPIGLVFGNRDPKPPRVGALCDAMLGTGARSIITGSKDD